MAMQQAEMLRYCTNQHIGINFDNNKQQAQRRAAGDRSRRKYSEKYVFMSKNMTFGPLGHVLTLLKGPPN